MIKYIKNVVTQVKTWVTKLWSDMLSFLTNNPKTVLILFAIGLVVGTIDYSLGLFIIGGYALFLLYRKGLNK
jgi:hypothetical protein